MPVTTDGLGDFPTFDGRALGAAAIELTSKDLREIKSAARRGKLPA